ncbi:MAG: DUF1778 domain-containing protein [Scytonema sp. RU_4_4]|nr:DUF1778 domain-containing protein [Scytonema sp. RU_4_4]NJR75979.1 DUF1778 domain-containing protein [Scytonema sp. CRU_2_7]
MSRELSTGSTRAHKIRKNARLEARVTEEQKQLMERAAYLRGQNLTEFMVAVLAETAIQIIKDHEFLELTERDRVTFAEALLNPPAPSEQAYADAQWYKQIMKKSFKN